RTGARLTRRRKATSAIRYLVPPRRIRPPVFSSRQSADSLPSPPLHAGGIPGGRLDCLTRRIPLMFLASALVAVLLQAASSAAPVDPEKEPFQTLETKLSGAIQAKKIGRAS